MSDDIFRKITRATNLYKHLITIEMKIEAFNLSAICPLKSETFKLTDTDECFLELSYLSYTSNLFLILRACDVKNLETIKGFTLFISDGNESLVHFCMQPVAKLQHDHDLLHGFDKSYLHHEHPLKIIVYLVAQNTVEEVKSEVINHSEHIDFLRQLSVDFMKIYDEEIGADVKLLVDDLNIKAHKTVLRSRSPVFNKMFELETSESIDSVIYIKDIRTPIIKEFLAFLYTGIKKDLDLDSTKDLYYVADKYEVLSLRDTCKKDLLDRHLEEDNACELLILADQHCDESFKEKVMAFIRKNLKSVIKTKIFEELNENYPQLALTLMRNHFLENSS